MFCDVFADMKTAQEFLQCFIFHQKCCRGNDPESMHTGNIGEIQFFFCLSKKIINSCQNTIADVMFIDGVKEMSIHSSFDCECTLLRRNAHTTIGMTEGRGNVFRIVVEIPSPVRPSCIVEEDWGKMFLFSGFLFDQEKFVEDGVPVVVSVDEDEIIRRDLIECIEAEFFMEYKCISMCFLQCSDIALWLRINGVEDCTGFFAILQNFLRMEPLSDANFDDHARTNDCKCRMDN